MRISRVWAMPNKNTFEIQPIGDFIMRYLASSRLSLDPFARDSQFATMTNDLNPKTKAQAHQKALDWLRELSKQKVEADLIIFDPPYSSRQVKECYENVGQDFTLYDVHNSIRWTDEKRIISELCNIGGYALSFGWNTQGIGLQHGFEIVEILIVCHGGAHNDTLCVAEKKVRHQTSLFSVAA